MDISTRGRIKKKTNENARTMLCGALYSKIMCSTNSTIDDILLSPLIHLAGLSELFFFIQSVFYLIRTNINDCR